VDILEMAAQIADQAASADKRALDEYLAGFSSEERLYRLGELLLDALEASEDYTTRVKMIVCIGLNVPWEEIQVPA